MSTRHEYDGVRVFTIRRQEEGTYRVHDGDEELGVFDGVYIDDCRMSSDTEASVDLQARTAVANDGVLTFFTR